MEIKELKTYSKGMFQVGEYKVRTETNSDVCIFAESIFPVDLEKGLKLEVGGGEVPRKREDGFINIDIFNHELVDLVCDIDNEKGRLPIQNDSVVEIFSSHCLEHIENTKNFLNELHRVSRDGCVAEFIVPYGLHRGSFKPVHKQYITECWFDFLRKENTERVYGYKRWDILENGFFFEYDPSGEIYQMTVKLKPIK